MFVPSTFGVALLMTILSTVCWGSFANTFKGTKNYRFELYYWDYGLGIFLIALVLAFTMGSYRGGPTAFVANVHSADYLNLGYAALGGFIFNIANVLLIAGIEIVGLSVAFPISIGIALVEGVVLSYALQPRGNAVLLGAGVLMAVVAVVLVGKSYGALGLLGGAIWGLGTVFNFVAASLVGVAISYAIGQASPMVACLWGVFAWKEFKGANGKAKGYLAAMVVSYLLALVLIARAYAG